MSTIVKVFQGVKSFLKQLNIKAPWMYTGINASIEYMSHLPDAETYRSPSPASAKKIFHVPESDPEHVLDIGYYNREPLGPEEIKNAGIITQKRLEGLPLRKIYGEYKKYALNDDGPDGGCSVRSLLTSAAEYTFTSGRVLLTEGFCWSGNAENWMEIRASVPDGRTVDCTAMRGHYFRLLLDCNTERGMELWKGYSPKTRG